MSNYKRKYHKKDIAKGTLGEFSKVWEEFEELKDASNQNLVLMCLCELSDILGALHAVIPDMFNNTDMDNMPIIQIDDEDETLALDELFVNLFMLHSALYINDTKKDNIDIVPIVDGVLKFLHGLTNLYKHRLSFSSVIAFMEKTKEACNENR